MFAHRVPKLSTPYVPKREYVWGRTYVIKRDEWNEITRHHFHFFIQCRYRADIQEWCREQFGHPLFDLIPHQGISNGKEWRYYPGGRWACTSTSLFFETQDDVMMFKLAWSGMS